MARDLSSILRYIRAVLEMPETQVRAFAAVALGVVYFTIAQLHVLANPYDFTYVVMNPVNRGLFTMTHAFMSNLPPMAVFFKVVYYAGFSLTLLFTPIYLGLLKDFKRLDRLYVSIIIAYMVAFPIFYTAVVYEPVVVGYGYMEDMLLWEGQDFASTNFMTYDTFCLPSGHTFLTTLCALAVVGTKKAPRYFPYAMAILVPMSTIFLTQHWFEDLITGYLLAYFAFRLSKCATPPVTRHLDRLSGRLFAWWMRNIEPRLNRG